MPTEFLYATSHIDGTFINPNNAVGNTPSTWAGDVNQNSNYTSRWAIGDPTETLTGTQTIRVVARKGSNSGTPTMQVNLYESGTLVQSLVATTNITSTTGQTLTGTFDASAITNRANIEIEVVQTGTGGNATTRNCSQISRIEYEAQVVESGPVSIAPNNSSVSVVSTQPSVSIPATPFDWDTSLLAPGNAYRQLVRTSGGILYASVWIQPTQAGGGFIAIFKSTNNGVTWTEQDPNNRPNENPRVDPAFKACQIVIDSNDVIHMVWLPGGHESVCYGTFDTSTDTYTNKEEIFLFVHSVGEYQDASIAVDSNNVPHISMTYLDDGGQEANSIEYVVWDTNTWNWLEVNSGFSTFNFCPIEVDSDDLPVIAYSISGDLYAAIGDNNIPTFFDSVTIGSVGGSTFTAHRSFLGSIAIDSSNNIWLAYSNASTEITVIRHLGTDDWFTWQTPVSNSEVGSFASIALHSGIAYVFYTDGTVVGAAGDNAKYDTFDGSVWDGSVVLHTTASSDKITGPMVREAHRNNAPNGDYGLDYLYWTPIPVAGGRTFYGNLSLDQGDSVSPADSSVLVNSTEPALTQKHTIQPEDSAVAVVTTEAATSVASDIGVDDTFVNVVSTEPTLTQKHVIQPDDSVVSVVTTEGVLAAAGVIGVHPVIAPVITTEPTLVQSHVIQPDNSSVGVVSTQPNITPSGITYTSGSEVVQGTVLQTETIVPDNSTVTVVSTEPTLTQSHTLHPNDSSVVVVSTEPTLSHKYTVQPDNSSVGVSTEEPTLTQSHTLQPNDSQVVTVTEESELSSAGHIGVNNTSVNVTTTEPSLTQSHTIQPDNSVVEVNTTEAGLTQSHSLQPDNSAVLVEFTQPSIVQAHVLQPDNSVVSVSTTQATISTAGTINPDDSIVAVSSSEAALTQSHILVPDDSQSQVFTSATSVSASYTITVDSSIVGVSTTEPDLDVAVGLIQPHDSMVIVVTTQPAFTTSGFRNIDVDPLDGPVVYTTVSDAHLSALFIGETHLGPLGISAPSVVFIEDVSVGIWIVGEPHLGPIAVGEPHVGMIVSEPAI